MARVMMNWSLLLLSKCEDLNSFLSFYSKKKDIMHKVNKGNLIAAKDNAFLEAYFSIAVEATEPHTGVKGFLRDTNTTYSETLELIHASFRVQTAGEHLCDTTTHSESTAIVRMGKTDDDVILKKTNTPLKTTGPFPNNQGNLLPS